MAIAFVDSTTGTADASGGSIAAAAANHVAGNLLAVGVNWASAAGTLDSIADTAGNVYTRFPGSKEDAGNDNVEWFYCSSILGNAANVVTATFSVGSTFRRIIVFQISGYTSATADKTGVNALTAVTSIDTGALTLTDADEIICSISGSSGADLNWAPTDGGTHQVNSLGGDTDVWYEIVASVGPHTASIAGGSNQDIWMTTVTFKEAAVASVTPTFRTRMPLFIGRRVN